MPLTDLRRRLALDEDLSPPVQSQLLRFIELLLRKNEVMNITRITSVEGLYEAHIRDSMQIIDYLPSELSESTEGRLLDLGTGAGFPGMIIKIVRPEWQVVLVDSVRKKLNFLDEVIADLGLKDVQTIHARAEDLGQEKKHRESYDIVTARAVAQLPVLLEYCLPLVKLGGSFLAMKTLEEELQVAERACRVLGGELQQSVVYQNPSYEDPTKKTGDQLVIHEFKKLHHTPGQYPRRAGTVRQDPIV